MQNFSMNFIDSNQTPLANSLACDGNVDLHQCRSPIVVDSANAKQPVEAKREGCLGYGNHELCAVAGSAT
jgi:hypothetical protein